MSASYGRGQASTSGREVRCDHKLHGVLTEDGTLEVKCSSSYCGARKGEVVLHYFNVHTGEMINTRKFADPGRLFKESVYGSTGRTGN